MKKFYSIALLFVIIFSTAFAQKPKTETKLLRFPDIHYNQIVFVYAGDIYTVTSEGGTARQITTFKGEELFPKISPDGRWIAFSAEYTGNRQVYIMPAEGGTPKQLTYYNPVGNMPPRGGYDYQILGWTPDSKNVLFLANRTPWGGRMSKYYTISIDGGLEKELPPPHGGTGELSPDGKSLVFTPIDREWRTWKRHRGGRAQDVWVYDLEKNDSYQITTDEMTDNMPMWIGNKLYYTSDREYYLNIWSYDMRTKREEKITMHAEYDVLWPSSGPDDKIIYQNGGMLFVLDVNSRKYEQIQILIQDDAASTMPYFKNVKKNIQSFDISPCGNRVLFDARGDIFSVPAKHGQIRNLTNSTKDREIYPTYSPDGKWIAYYSDVIGEYNIFLMPTKGDDEPKKVSPFIKTWLFPPSWSPDSKKLLFADKEQTLNYLDVETEKLYTIDSVKYGDFETYSWSPDSRWILYSKPASNYQNQIYVYSLDDKKVHQLGSGMSNNHEPVFTKDGQYIVFFSLRDFNLSFSEYEFDYLYDNAAKLYAAALTKDAKPFLPAKSDEVQIDNEDDKNDKDKKEDKKDELKVRIEPDGFENRVTSLPLPNGAYRNLQTSEGTVLYIRDGTLYSFNICEQKEEEVLSAIGTYILSANGSSILANSRDKYSIVANQPKQNFDSGVLDLTDMTKKIVPLDEWEQIYSDAWRLMRDWFYDPGMHGYDWGKIGHKYDMLLEYLNSRQDLDFLIGEMIGEVNAGHTYVNAGDQQSVDRIDNGLLGCKFEDTGDKYYRISKIYQGENWHEIFRSPLTDQGIDVNEGDYLIKICGEEVTTKDNPYKFLENKAEQYVKILVNSKPSESGAKEYKIKTIKSELELFFLDWIRENREYVDKKSNGKIGYIWLPNTLFEGNRELYKWFYPQARNKEAFIYDDRYNGGGFIPSMMIELLDRKTLNYWKRKGLEPQPEPLYANDGPKVCLINGYSSSGGDAFPYYFKKKGLGQLIGTRTWGGLIGISGNPSFVDGGALNIPTFRVMNPEGEWIIENEGVSPDIKVVDDPHLVAKGIDPSLDKAIEILLEELKKNPSKKVIAPPAPDESLTPEK